MKTMIYSHINLDYMDLMSDGDMDMKKTMLEMLLEELPAEITKIVNLAEIKDYKTIKAVSHKLKSTLAFVGNKALDITNQGVEKIAIEEGNCTELRALAERMQDNCNLVMVELQVEFGKL